MCSCICLSVEYTPPILRIDSPQEEINKPLQLFHLIRTNPSRIQNICRTVSPFHPGNPANIKESSLADPSDFLSYDINGCIINPFGDEVKAGDELGRIGNWNETTGRVELQINNKSKKTGEEAHCPLTFATEEFIEAHKAFTETWCLEETVKP